jgi:hypothetical protein
VNSSAADAEVRIGDRLCSSHSNYSTKTTDIT